MRTASIKLGSAYRFDQGPAEQLVWWLGDPGGYIVVLARLDGSLN